MKLRHLSVAVAATLFPVAALSAPVIEIELDKAFVEQVQAVFEAGAAKPVDLDAIVHTAGAIALIQKVQGYAPDADEALLKEALQRAARGEKWDEDPFYFWHSYRQRDKTRRLLSQLGPTEVMAGKVGAALEPYLPEDFTLRTRIVLVLGGASAGWTTGDGSFEVGLDHHADDPAVVIEKTAAHEIYHVAQEKLLPPEPTDLADPDDRVDALLRALVQEGTASLQDDFSGIKEQGKLLTYIRDKQQMNRNRIGPAFLLLETLVLRTANDPEADLGQLYSIGFLDPWGSSGYEVGRVMAEAIVAVDGSRAIPRLLHEGPRAFVRRYVEISRDNKELPQFTTAFAERLRMRQEP